MNPALRAAIPMMFALLATTPATADAQGPDFGYGASFVTRYLWRGVPYNSIPQIQPWISVAGSRVEVGVWGSYGLDGDYKEQDAWISLTSPLARGSLVFTLTDYYFTEDYKDFFDWGGVEDGVATGAHTLEAEVAWSGPDDRPLRLLLASTVYNDPSPSVYGAVGYDLEGAGFTWSGDVGYLFQDGGYYEIGGSGLINLSLSATRALGSVGPLEPFATGAVIHNAKLGQTFFLLELGF